MITHSKKTANAVGGKTARACESCLKRRARWFCAADDAFLCQACDSSVHSANELASRHNRVRLESKINIQSSKLMNTQPSASPSWHQGFTKKARTPRSNSNAKANKPSYNNYEMRVVPEVSNEDDDQGSIEGNEEDRNEAVFSVPNLEVNDPFEIKEFKNSNNNKVSVVEGGFEDDFNISLIGFEGDNNEWENYLPAGFLASDNELAEFAADVESLLEHEAAEEGGRGNEEADDELQLLYPGVKIEEEGDISATTDHCYFDWSIDVESEMFNFDLNQTYGNNSNHDQSQVSGVEEDEEEDGKKMVVPKHEAAEMEEEELEGGKDMEANNKRRKILLRLNYDEVINAWASQGCLSPWTTGRRPEFEFDHHGWPYCMGGMFPTGVPHCCATAEAKVVNKQENNKEIQMQTIRTTPRIYVVHYRCDSYVHGHRDRMISL